MTQRTQISSAAGDAHSRFGVGVIDRNLHLSLKTREATRGEERQGERDKGGEGRRRGTRERAAKFSDVVEVPPRIAGVILSVSPRMGGVCC